MLKLVKDQAAAPSTEVERRRASAEITLGTEIATAKSHFGDFLTLESRRTDMPTYPSY